MSNPNVAERDFRTLPISEMEAIITRFNERVNAAQQANPPTKDWVKQAIHRQGGKRSPVRLKRMSLDIIVRYGDALADLFCEFPDDVIPVIPYDWSIGYQLPGKKDPVNTVEALMKDARWEDEWGARWGHAFGGVGAIQMHHPLEDWSQLDDYIARMPDPRGPGRLDAAVEQIAMHGKTKYCYGVCVQGVFEILRSVRGMQNLFMDFHTNEADVRKLMDAICDYLCELIRYWAEIGADCFFYGDDWGMQTGLMISPGMWREFFKSYYKKMFDESHRLGMDVLVHSCGNVLGLIEDFIDVGVDVLDPIQPGAMDYNEVAAKFGGRISFSGGIDIQDLMVFGEPQHVKDEVRKLIDTMGTKFGNGFVVGPANAMTPDIPLKNLRAMFEACRGH
ncbi:MAG: hypothetical protein M1133_02025 [Armatimonadetes bacterium]|nr:hypothetical protein [Armatimonadota bacterium]